MSNKAIGQYKVLVVDDSRLYSSAIRNIVSTKFESVETALSGQEAIDKLPAFCPDIVLLDVTMPNMDGRECLEKILKARPQTIVLMISGIQKEDLKQECLKLGAELFINKDQIKMIDGKTDNFLIQSIEAVLGKRNTGKAV